MDPGNLGVVKEDAYAAVVRVQQLSEMFRLFIYRGFYSVL